MRDDPSSEHARRIHADEVERCRRMAAHAAELLAPGTRALTHCNAGGLATGGYGSAVGALLTAWERGLLAHVWVDETRPLLQGARLTAWELEAASIPHAVIADSAAASLMAAGEVDCVITGADRIAANGDTANKIGTYSLAVLASHHAIPFYIVAPTTTLDPAARGRRGDPDRGARPGRDHRAVRRAQPGLRRHAGRADHGDRHRAGRPPRAVRAIARRRRGSRMKAIMLAAGYATRLRPLTDTWAKELLPVGGRPIIDWIVDAVAAVELVDEIHVVTNARKVDAFARWAEGRDVIVHDDGTSSNDDRLGAIGDMLFVVEQAGLDDDLLVIAGDNLFEFSLADFAAFWRSKGTASAVAVRDVGSLELAAQYGIVALDDDGADRRLRGEARRPAVHARGHGDVPLPSRARAADRDVSRGRARRRPAGPVRRLAAAARARLRLGLRRRPGTTSGTTSSCWRRTTSCAPLPACRSASDYSPE